MKNYHDPVTGQYWAFEDDVVVTETEAGVVFFTAEGEALDDAPLSLVPVEEIPPIPSPVVVPQIVSRFQGREAMWQTPHGEVSLFEAAEVIINHPDTPPTYKRAWQDLQEFRRDSAMLVAIATALGLSRESLDALFILAGGIKA